MAESPFLAWGGLSTKQTFGGLNLRLEYFDFILLLFLHFGFIYLIILSIKKHVVTNCPVIRFPTGAGASSHMWHLHTAGQWHSISGQELLSSSDQFLAYDSIRGCDKFRNTHSVVQRTAAVSVPPLNHCRLKSSPQSLSAEGGRRVYFGR
jgi:hypothetical protein